MDQATVFISYSRKQFYVAEYLAQALERQGLSTWLDVQKILPGVDWQASIDQGLATCQAFILVASRSAYQSAAVQYEVSTARAAGKPIYLAVIEDTLFVAELSAVATVIDCQNQFAVGVTAIAQAIKPPTLDPAAFKQQFFSPGAAAFGQAFQRSKLLKTPYRRAGPLSLRMPFGRFKYLQLLYLCLCYLVGTCTILLHKQVAIHGPFTARFLPFLVLAAIPVVSWCLVFAYSLRLLFAFRRQGRVTYLALELWPALNVFLFPALYQLVMLSFSTQAPYNGPDTGFGLFFNTTLSITDRTSGPTFGWQIFFLFSAWGVYLFFLAYSLRGWLLALGWIPLVVFLFYASSLPGLVPPLVLLAVGGGIVFLSMRSFLNGRDAPFAFGEKWSFTQSTKTLVNAVLRYIFLVPGLKNQPSLVRASLWASEPPDKDRLPAANWAWGRWLMPGSFPNEAFVRAYQPARTPAPATSAGKTWRLFYVPADASSAQAIRRLLAGYPALHESPSDSSDYQIAILSNKTPRRWVDTLAKRYPLLICIIISSLDFNRLAATLQQHQWIDYRQQRPYQIDNLAKALSGMASSINATTPENFARTVAPYPVKLVVNALRMGGAASVVLGVAAQLLAITDRVTLAPLPLVVASVVFGLWAWWEAGRLLARNTILPTVLFTWGALIIILGSWVLSGATGALLPREVWVHNGPYNSLLTNGLAFLASFIGLPLLLFLVVGGIELVRNSGTLRCWLPRPGWPRWQRTLAVAPWRRLDVSLLLYAIATLAVIATLVVDSPYHYQHIHEYDVTPSISFHLSEVLAGPDGNVWFGMDGKAEYDIGSIAPNGDIQLRRLSIPEPVGCSPNAKNTFACFAINDLQFGPDHNLWYVAEQLFPPYITEIQRATLAGAITRYSLPKRGLSGIGFAFDAAGNLWYTRQGDFLHNEPSQIGRLDVTSSDGSITEFTLPAPSLPIALVAGPDGNMWFFDDGTHEIGKITLLGSVTEYPLPYQERLAGTSQEEMVLGADHNLWFTDPLTGMVGRITSTGEITVYDGEINSNPRNLLAAPDGSIWFIDRDQQALGHIPHGGQLTFYPFHTLMSVTSSLTIGPDGNIWVTLYNQIGRVTAAGAITLYDVPSLDASLWGIVTGSNRHLWFVEYNPGIIGELTP